MGAKKTPTSSGVAGAIILLFAGPAVLLLVVGLIRAAAGY